jgi:ketosteroid isomerase-like protein
VIAPAGVIQGIQERSLCMADAAGLAATYFRAWRDRDFELFRSVLADDVTFDGPMGQARNADECVAGIRGLSQITTGIVIRRVFADGDDVTTWFELHTSATTEPLLVANWSHVRDGKIAAIRVTFDPRPLG